MAIGDHFFIWRCFRGVPFQHHAIEVEEENAVHFSDGEYGIAGPGGPRERYTVLRTPLDRITRGGRDRTHIVGHPLIRSRAEIVDRAMSHIGRRGYHLLFNNCEHFANWCVVGSEASRQVEIACERAASAGVKTMASSAARLASRVGLGSVARGLSPWILAADAVQWATEAGGHHVGLTDPSERQRVGRLVGGATALGLGALGGPVGVALAGGTWLAGEMAGQFSRQVYAHARGRHRPEPARIGTNTDEPANPAGEVI